MATTDQQPNGGGTPLTGGASSAPAGVAPILTAAPAAIAQKQASHPGLELSLFVISLIASAALTVETVVGSFALFGGSYPTFSTIVSFFFSGLSGFTGLTITALGALVFGLVAFVLARRVSNAVEDGKYKAVLHVGFGIAAFTTLVLAITTVATGLSPLLTLREGVNVGPTYLWVFLPQVISLVAFAFVTFQFSKLLGSRAVASTISTVVLGLGALAFVLGLVAVIVKSHGDTALTSGSGTTDWSEYFNTSSGGSSGSSSDRSSGGSSFDSDSEDTDTGSSRGSGSGGSSWGTSGDSSTGSGSGSGTSNTSQCVNQYLDDRDYDAYMDCLGY